MTEKQAVLRNAPLADLQQLGPYRLEAVLGVGSQGVVYRATDVLLRRSAAVKVARSPGGAQPGLAEARLTSALDHPNIVRVYHVERMASGWFMAMEFVDGGNAWELLTTTREGSHERSERRRGIGRGATPDSAQDRSPPVLAGGGIEPALAVRIIAQAAGALDHAHQAGIVHRDVKLQNLLLTRTGVVKLSDFGLAVRGHRPTEGGEPVGTPLYIAPEIWQGSEAGPAADVYALGACLYLLLSGRSPFQGSTLEELRRAHLTDVAPPIPQVIEPLTRLLASCLSRTPADRPTATALRRSLLALQPLLEAPAERYFPFTSMALLNREHLLQVVLELPAFTEARQAVGRALRSGGRPFLLVAGRYCVCTQAVLLLATDEEPDLHTVGRVLIDEGVDLAERLEQVRTRVEQDLVSSRPGARVMVHLHMHRGLTAAELDLLFRQPERPLGRAVLFVITGLPGRIQQVRRDAEASGREALLRWVALPRLSDAELAQLSAGWALALGREIRFWTADAQRLLRSLEDSDESERLIHNAILLTCWCHRAALTTWAVQAAAAHPGWLADAEEVLPPWRTYPLSWPEAPLLQQLRSLRPADQGPPR